MNMPRPLILISNDDGVDAPGIKFLSRVASRHGDVIVVAPASAQSGKSSALTVNAPLILKPVADYPECEAKVYSVNGTPVDCIKVAMHAVTPHRPALILSGMNHGSNAAVNNIYSGTMGAAMEGCIVGIPSVGFSILSHSWDVDMKPTEHYVDHVIRYVLTHGLPDGICLNVNFPAAPEVKGLKVTRAARGYWSEEYADYTTPSGEPFYWLTGRFINLEPEAPDTDEYWLKRDYGSVVPIRPDQTALDMMSGLASLGE